MSETVKTERDEMAVLRQYKDTHEGLFMQGIKGADALWADGLLTWHGSQYGCNFYSISEAGRAALSLANKDT